MRDKDKWIGRQTAGERGERERERKGEGERGREGAMEREGGRETGGDGKRRGRWRELQADIKCKLCNL